MLREFWLLSGLVCTFSTCLNNSIQEEERHNISMKGVSMPIGLSVSDWGSSHLMSEIYAILAREVLGYHVAYRIGGNGLAALQGLIGCPSPVSNYSDCQRPSRHHLALEVWEEQTKQPTWLQLQDEMEPDSQPRTLGTMGYQGFEGLFVMERASRSCRETTGLHLSYYGNYNASWFSPQNCTMNLEEVNSSFYATCQDAVTTGYPDTAQHYLTATGDAEGVTIQDGRVELKCWQGKWWLAPACRDRPQKCIAAPTGGPGWGFAQMIQQATFNHMPLAFATAANWEAYLSEVRALESVAYYWSPDSALAQLEPRPVQFEAHNAADYAQGIYKSMAPRSRLLKLVDPGLEVAAPRAQGLASSISLADSEIKMLVDLHVELGGSFFDTACTWLKTNPNAWSEWIPDKTQCPLGKGLVDEMGNFVMDAVNAVDCQSCPAGRASEPAGRTHVCSTCAPGSFQNVVGSSSCRLCEPGSFAAAGSSRCEACGLGTYSGAGMSSCHRCGASTGRPEQWTTMKEISVASATQMVQVLGAQSASSCACKPGSFLWQGRCELCGEGADCPGGARLLLLPGYFASVETPLRIYRCGAECPGGLPGTCAEGRDATSVACGKCKAGYGVAADGRCEECDGRDSFFLVSIFSGGLLGIIVLYHALLMESKQPSQLAIIILGLAQLLTMIQMLGVVRRFDIQWREPFSDLLLLLELASFDVGLLSFDCLGQIGTVSTFALRAFMLPLILLLCLMVHFGHLLVTRSRGFQLHRLLRTQGSIIMVFFIGLFTLLLAPLQCDEHPNGLFTVRRYREIRCDGNGRQFMMFVAAGFASLLPIGFIALCTWVVVYELPRRLARSDLNFLANCSFLVKRFRPGGELFIVVFLIRNTLVTMCPLITTQSGRLVMMSIIVYANLVLVAFMKPWRYMVCNFLDILLAVGMLLILDMGSVSVKAEDPVSTAVVVVVFVCAMLLAVALTLCFAVYKFILQKYRKLFRFFLCHQKNASGAMARLLKLELEKALVSTKTFIDCDDLTDFSRLFSYVGQDTHTLVVLGTRQILTRKWCVGELVAAHVSHVTTLLLAWPDFELPSERFVADFAAIVPDIHELAKFGIGLEDVQHTLRWLGSVPHLDVPEIRAASVKVLVDQLTGTCLATVPRVGETLKNPIVVDHGDREAMACALLLSEMLRPRLVGTHVVPPSVLPEDTKVHSKSRACLVICTEKCLESQHVKSCLLQALTIAGCCMIPVITEDSFMAPTEGFYQELPRTEEGDSLGLAIRALFLEMAVVFVPQNYSSTHEELDLRAKRASMRLLAQLQPMAEKIEIIQRDQKRPESPSTTFDESDEHPLQSKTF